MIPKVMLWTVAALVPLSAPASAVQVALVRSFPPHALDELNNNWQAYGSVPLSIDTSLMDVSSFSHQDLIDTGADVLWLNNCAGYSQQLSPVEVEAVRQYANEGHSLLATYLVFGHWPSTDNSALAPVWGLPEVQYCNDNTFSLRTMDILVSHPLFRDIPDPYVSGGNAHAQLPADDYAWDPGDFGAAQLLAQAADRHSIITWYETADYHATFVSLAVQFEGNATDTQFLYNALTVPEPATVGLLAIGAFALHRRRRGRSAGRSSAAEARRNCGRRRTGHRERSRPGGKTETCPTADGHRS
jgi:hypothetical protein